MGQEIITLSREKLKRRFKSFRKSSMDIWQITRELWDLGFLLDRLFG